MWTVIQNFDVKPDFTHQFIYHYCSVFKDMVDLDSHFDSHFGSHFGSHEASEESDMVMSVAAVVILSTNESLVMSASLESSGYDKQYRCEQEVQIWRETIWVTEFETSLES